MNNGIFGENFPYSNFHDLNMDWIIKIAKDFLDQYTHIQEIIEQGKTDIQSLTTTGLEQLQEKADNLEELLQAWYNEHSEDIANQLASALADLNAWYNEHSEDIANQLTVALADFATAYNTTISQFETTATAKGHDILQTLPPDYTEMGQLVNRLENDNDIIIKDIYSSWKQIVSSSRIVNGYKIVTVGEGAIQDPDYATIFFPISPDRAYLLNLTSNDFGAFATSDSADATFGTNFADYTGVVIPPANAHYFVVSMLRTDWNVKIYNTIPNERSVQIYSHSGWLASDGSFTGAVYSYNTNIIPCKAGEVFLYTGNSGQSAVTALFYIDGVLNSSLTKNCINETIPVVIPNNINGVVFSSYAINFGDIVFSIKTPEQLMETYQKYGYMTSYYVKKGFLTSLGNYTDNTALSKNTSIIPTAPGDVFLYKGVGEVNAVSALFYNNGTIVGNVIIKAKTEYYPISIPDGANGVLFSSYAVTNDPDDIIFDVHKLNDATYKISGKTLGCDGDSIASGDVNGGGFVKIISGLLNMPYENDAVGGATLVTGTYLSEQTPRHWISTSIESLDVTDYVIVQGGVNDFAIAEAYGSINLGTISNNYNDRSDTDNLCGALEHICYVLQTRFANQKKGFLFTHRIFYSENWNTWKNTMIEILNKWGIPYLDLEKIVPPLNFIPDMKTAYTVNGDGWHPNVAGYDKYYVPHIINWLESM